MCGLLYRSEHDKFKNHGFELKLSFSIFSKFNQIKINKTGVKLQAYVSLQISLNLKRKSMDWFLYDNGLRHERVK